MEESSFVGRIEFPLRRVVEVCVYRSISYLALCRKITYLNACPESPMYDARTGLQALYLELAAGAQKQGDFRQDVPTEDIVHIVMGIQLMAQFEWPEISKYSEEHCMERLRWYFDTMLQGVMA